MRTVGNGSVISRLVEAIGREGVGDASELRLDQSVCYGIVKPLNVKKRMVSWNTVLIVLEE